MAAASFFFLAVGALLLSLSPPVVHADAELVRRMCEQFHGPGEDDEPFEHCKACLYQNPEAEQANVCGLTELLFKCVVSALASARQVSSRLVDLYPLDDPRREPLESCLILFRTASELMNNAYPLIQRWEYGRARDQVRNVQALGFQGCLAAFESIGDVPSELLHPMTDVNDLCRGIWVITDDLRFSYTILCQRLLITSLPPL